MPLISLWRIGAICIAACFFFMLTACASNGNSVDPWENSNRFFYKANDSLDRVALKPLSDGYVKVVPKPVRTCVSNTFDNLGYFNVIFNDFLQGKSNQGWSDSGRMLTNSTIGIAGFFDVATQWHMPSHENDFGITLGTWGASAGPYMVLPFFGPTCGRDAPGIAVGFATDPTTYLHMPLAVAISLYTAEAIDARSRAEREFKFRNAASIDPYIFTRNAYLQYREAQIHPGQSKPQQSIYDEDLDSGAATQPASTRSTTQPATQPSTAK